MKLTPEQIKGAVDYAEMRVVDELAAAYQRVEALSSELDDRAADHYMYGVAAGMLRRALYGEGEP